MESISLEAGIPQHYSHRQFGMLSPLDLSLRSSAAPMTPPSTPSPPRKKQKSLEDYSIWRPHTLGYFDNTPFSSWNSNSLLPIDSESNEEAKGDAINAKVTNHNIDIEETIVLTEDDTNNDEEFVDVLSNDDEPPVYQQLTSKETENHNAEEDKEIKSAPLSRNKLVYEDAELHAQAVEGFERLFRKSFEDETVSTSSQEKQTISSNEIQECQKQIMKNRYEKRKMKIRKQLVDEDNSSPVSGTIIRKLREDEELVIRKGDIDPAFNVVEITEEAKSLLASIDNKIGSYLCQLCRTLYDDAFQLAQHRCTRIVHIEYRCSECDKVFNCPANLASHRRWHKPKGDVNTTDGKKSTPEKSSQVCNDISQDDGNQEGIFTCNECGKAFRRHAYLKKHLQSHQMLEELKSNERGKHPPGSILNPHNYQMLHSQRPRHPILPQIAAGHRLYAHNSVRYPPFPLGLDQRRIHSLSEFYFNHCPDRLSAFQYVQNPVAAVHRIPLPGFHEFTSMLPSTHMAVK
ncbi:unnamed protein product [Hermetia illucens]|uniref:C2H2-type domain-containing protein n=1 Tax=Hermetia illucens TaxID=343691 RepID=A0A7R8UQZ6_HERIL|nr:zinc finger protein 200 [Hermetia illucens]CAD7084443.1 unnamed protein product [Hermetia illucens]